MTCKGSRICKVRGKRGITFSRKTKHGALKYWNSALQMALKSDSSLISPSIYPYPTAFPSVLCHRPTSCLLCPLSSVAQESSPSYLSSKFFPFRNFTISTIVMSCHRFFFFIKSDFLHVMISILRTTANDATSRISGKVWRASY